MRLIDADALKFKNVAEVNGILTHILTPEEIYNAPTVEPTFGLFRTLFCETCQAYATNRAIVKLADEYTRPQGEWISKHLWDNTHIWVCSECGNQNTHGITVEKACWKCGAKMRGCEEE